MGRCKRVGTIALLEATLHLDSVSGSSLGLKLKSLGAEADDLGILLQAVKPRGPVAANAEVIREPSDVRQLTVLLSGTTCSYRRNYDGGRSILSFQHAGDFCAFWRGSMLEAAVYRQRLTKTNRGTALERVAHLLCEQLARREVVGIHTPRLPFSQIDVADAAGLSVVHVNRTIQNLRSLGVLSKASHIEVIDRERLEQLAKFDGLYLSPLQSFPSLGSAGLARLNPRSLSARVPVA